MMQMIFFCEKQKQGFFREVGKEQRQGEKEGTK